ncbi:MAG TPA: hypothetical protein PLI45_03945 [Candidatus Woesebacteria bacterium]|nr:hypothetical protein [Candidatus Woesebacteria bacterium]
MKKISVLITLVGMMVLFVPGVWAKNETAGSGSVAGQTNAVSPAKTAVVMNQNQVKTQNAGDESQLMIQTSEQEEALEGTKSAAPRSVMALEHMSLVAKGVEEILTTKTLKGGIGDQVRVLAQEQKQSQDQMRLQVDKVASRSGLLKSLIGPDYRGMKSIESLMAQNELRIQRLTELMNQLTNSGDKTMVKEMIETLVQQNTSLQTMINEESVDGSLFGWLVKLFIK